VCVWCVCVCGGAESESQIGRRAGRGQEAILNWKGAELEINIEARGGGVRYQDRKKGAGSEIR
jgi:hypothetical protein